MKRKTMTVVAFATVFAAGGAFAEDAIGNIGMTRLKGYLGERLDAMIACHTGGTDINYITEPFYEKTDAWAWRTEFWGKYMHSAVPYAVYSRSPKIAEDITHGVTRILASQEKNGYVGDYRDDARCENWDVWGMKYTMMGLLHYYDLRIRTAKDDPRAVRALDACRRVCDYVIGEIGPDGRRGKAVWQTGNWSGFASSSILEPVMWLHNRIRLRADLGGEAAARKYLDFATFIVKGMTEPPAGPRLLDLALKGVSVADRNGYGNKAETNGGYVCRHNRWKAYEMMSCYQGMIEYARVTGRKELVDAAIATGRDIAAEEANLAGGCACSEAWFHGARKQHLPYERLQETCVTTTWMRFCETLLEETDDPDWADRLERTFYNAYLGALRADGSGFAAYTPLSGDRSRGMHHCRMHTNCCTANGPRGFLCFLRKFYVRKGNVGTFNFYTSARTDGFDMYSLYPRNGDVHLICHITGPFDLRLRIPAWSDQTRVKVNGEAVDGVKAGSYAAVSRTWKPGDKVEVSFEMSVVAHTLGESTAAPGAFSGGDDKVAKRPHWVAFTRGPILLARDSRFDDGDQMEPFRTYGVSEGRKMSGFAPVRVPDESMWMAFSAVLPIGTHSENPEGVQPAAVQFCDYASAGNAWNRKNYYRTWFPIEWGPTE